MSAERRESLEIYETQKLPMLVENVQTWEEEYDDDTLALLPSVDDPTVYSEEEILQQKIQQRIINFHNRFKASWQETLQAHEQGYSWDEIRNGSHKIHETEVNSSDTNHSEEQIVEEDIELSKTEQEDIDRITVQFLEENYKIFKGIAYTKQVGMGDHIQHIVPEDVLQDMILKFWRKRNDIDFDQNPFSYFYGSLMKQGIDEWRKFQRRVKIANTSNLQYERENDDEMMVRQSIEEQQEGTEEQVMRKETQYLVRKAIDELPVPQREVMLLRLEDKSQSEIAQELDISLGTIKTRCNLAQRKLRKIFDQDREILLT